MNALMAAEEQFISMYEAWNMGGVPLELSDGEPTAAVAPPSKFKPYPYPDITPLIRRSA